MPMRCWRATAGAGESSVSMAANHQRANFSVIAAPDAAALASTAADHVLARIVANGERVAICLAGGSSPKQLFELLATDAYRSQIPWQRVHWFIGDERFVAADDPLNNMAMARRTFLDRCAPAANVHPIATEGIDVRESARRYEAELQSFYGADRLDPVRPLFDVVLLGVGPDGHTASLFPGYPAAEETSALGGRRARGPCRAVRTAGHIDFAGARLLPRNAVRSERRRQARDPDPCV